MSKQEISITATKSVEDFLKAVYTLQQDSERVTTNALSEALSISAPSVTDMAQRLVEAEYIDYQKYYGVRVTDKGKKIALEVIRRHRLIELFLVQELGYEIHEVHDEAEALEHTVSDRFIEAISKKLDYPEFDPHGDPIPATDGSITHRNLLALSELPINTPATISRILSNDTQMLEHVLTEGFALNAQVEVIARKPFDGPIHVLIEGQEAIIGHNVADTILVHYED